MPHPSDERVIPGEGESGLDPLEVLAREAFEEYETSAGPRYVLRGEVGRGGIGVIFRGVDRELDREVAVKVLRHHHALNPRALRRFLDEARIGGRLQHPGVVPVYDLGRGDDGLPFMTMRLVSGETLAARLAAREGPGDGHARFLAIFASVSQTVAYAHERDVVHGDLKPANVMVGDHGEVHVLDWGLARAMAGDEGDGGDGERDGTPVGTPGYMSPEHAGGLSLGAPSDVFSLGAMLTEILTGAPLRGPEGSEPYGDLLAEARSRLERSSADRQLVELADRCLSPAPEGRPADAGEVARCVADHVDAREERAREARLDAARAGERARGERTLRRRTVAFAAAILIAAGLGTAAYLSQRARREERRERIASVATDELQRAELLRGRAASGGDLTAWAQAGAAVGRALAHLSDEDAPTALRTRATLLGEEIEAEEGDARLGRERERAEVELLELLLEDRVRHWSPFLRLGESAVAGDYARIFAEHGLSLDTLGHDQAVRRLEQSRHRGELAGHVLAWSMSARSQVPPETETAERLEAIAFAVDPDPLRKSICDALARTDGWGLRRLVKELDWSAQPASTAHLLAHLFLQQERVDSDLMTEFLTRAQVHHADDFLVNATLGALLYRGDEAQVVESLRYLTAALALRPESAEVRTLLAAAFVDAGRLEDARVLLLPLVSEEAGSAVAHTAMGKLLRLKGDLEGSLASYRRAIESDAEFSPAHQGLAITLRETGDREGGIRALEIATELQPDHHGHWTWLGTLQMESGRKEEALDAFRNAVSCDATWSTLNNLGCAYRELGRLEEAAAAFRESIRANPGKAFVHDNLGSALQAMGDHAAAVEALREAVRLEPDEPSHQRSLGLSLSELGNYPQAELHLSEALRLDPGSFTARVNLGRVLGLKGDYEGAKAQLRRAMEAQPNHPVPIVFLGRILANASDESARDLEQAVRLAKRAIELDAEASDPWLLLGMALYRSGEWSESLVALQRAGELGEDPECHYLRAMALERAGDRQGARKAFSLGRDLERVGEQGASLAIRNEDLRARLEAGEALGLPDEEP